MVSLEEIQAAYYMVAATGVLVAAVFYILNLRVSQRNQELMLKSQEQNLETRRIGVIDSITSRIIDSDGTRDYMELLRYEWKDYEDFERKYGSENNLEAATRRYTHWNSYNEIGWMLRKGIVEADDLYDAGVIGSIFVWAKYKPVIEEIRRRYFGQGYLRDFEYLAGEIVKVAKKRDPNYSVPEMLDKYVPDK